MRKLILLVLLLSLCIKRETIPIKVLPEEIKGKILEMEQRVRELDNKVYNGTGFEKIPLIFPKLRETAAWYRGAFERVYSKNSSYEELLGMLEAPEVDISGISSLLENVSYSLNNITLEFEIPPNDGNYSEYIYARNTLLNYMGSLSAGPESLTKKAIGISKLASMLKAGLRVGLDLRANEFMGDKDKAILLFSYPPEILNGSYDTILTADIKEVGIILDVLIDYSNGSVRKELLQYLSEFRDCDKFTCVESLQDVRSLLATSVSLLDNWVVEFEAVYRENWGIIERVHGSFKGEENPLLPR
jgi:hypothetical protein